MKRWLLLGLLLVAPRLHAQTQIQSFAADPGSCDSSRGLIYYNTITQQFRSCGPAPNTWNIFGGGGGGGTVTSVAATAPIVVVPNPITGAGTISCPTCTTTSSTIPINNVVSATGRITPIAIGDNTLPFTCAQATIPDCVTILESSPTPVSAGNSHLLLIENTAGSNSAGLVVFSPVNAAAATNAPPILYIQGETGGVPGASQNGFVGGTVNIFAGPGSAGGATTGNGGTGGQFSFSPGNGGAAGGSSANAGGNGGQLLSNLGSGGNGNTTGNGGAGGALVFIGGSGGNGGATSGTGGQGSDFLLTTGGGGSSASGSTTGRGGDYVISLGSGGSGAGATIARPGDFTIGQNVQGANTTSTVILQPTWNTTGLVDAAFRINLTDTASAAGSLLMDLYNGVTSEFKIDKSGNVTQSGSNLSLIANCATSNAEAIYATSTTIGCGNGDFTYTTHTFTAAAAGLVDLSAETSATGFRFPVLAGAAPASNGAIAYDSTSNTVRTSISAAASIIPTVPGTTNPTASRVLFWGANSTIAQTTGTASATITYAAGNILGTTDAVFGIQPNIATGWAMVDGQGSNNAGLALSTNTTTPVGIAPNHAFTHKFPVGGGIQVFGTAPTCTFTSGGGTTPSCTLNTGSTDDAGTIAATTGTGSPGGTGTITLTFHATYGTNAPVCLFMANNASGAGTWNGLAVMVNGPTTSTTSADVFTWTNGTTPTTLTASTAYWINYHCFAK